MSDTKTLEFHGTRRDFCAQTCRAVSAAALGGALATLVEACGGSSTSPSSLPALMTVNGGTSGRTVSVTVDAASPLASVGGAALVQPSVVQLGVFLVARTGPSAFAVLNATCTHEGCTVTGFSSGRYQCPCHDSQFDTSGRVLSGPAPRALTTYPSQFADPVLTFTV